MCDYLNCLLQRVEELINAYMGFCDTKHCGSLSTSDLRKLLRSTVEGLDSSILLLIDIFMGLSFVAPLPLEMEEVVRLLAEDNVFPDASNELAVARAKSAASFSMSISRRVSYLN